MKRRIALKQIGLTASAGLILPAWLSGCKDDEAKPEINYSGSVVVIGAGAAGLYAADILKAKGISVKVLEASSRLGGRIKTLRLTDKSSSSLLLTSQTELSNDFPIELGAERILGSDSLWAKTIAQQKIPTVDYTSTLQDLFMLDGQSEDGTTVGADADFVAAKNFFDNLINYSGANVSIQQAAQASGVTTRVLNIIDGWTINVFGATSASISAVAAAEGLQLLKHNAVNQLLKGNPMQDVLISRFNKIVPNVELNSVVRSINYAGDKITISGEKNTSSGTEPFSIEADKVIVTVPVSMLKKGIINFNPSLPQVKNIALSNLGMDSCIKVFLDFKKNFWGTGTDFILGGTKASSYFNAGTGKSLQERTLSVTISGAKAEQLALLGQDLVPQLLGELDQVFNNEATLNVRKDLQGNLISVIQDWSKEPYIEGGVSYVKAGGSNADRTALASAIDSKLFFAGEATEVNGEAGTISGALLSGERAAQEVIESILA